MRIKVNRLYAAAYLIDGDYNMIDNHIGITTKEHDDVTVYIDNIKVFTCNEELVHIKPTYYYKIPKQAVKIINNWSKSILKYSKMSDRLEYTENQFKINELYKEGNDNVYKFYEPVESNMHKSNR